MKAFKNGITIERPKQPKYRQGPMAVVTFTGRSVKLKDGMLRFPLGSKVKAWFGLDAFYLPMPSNLDFKAIREYRILPRNGCFYLEFVYKTTEIQSEIMGLRIPVASAQGVSTSQYLPNAGYIWLHMCMQLRRVFLVSPKL